ncbi:helicase-related protein [Thermogemmatispora onikobensis]|uniref:helicase-related protein n=1 Tax=Thermogemmatispora onikobensis TaxID=732234 RepID=UPI000852BFF8|nr:helicase-related protein [Thermogemmatispora onikobensis]
MVTPQRLDEIRLARYLQHRLLDQLTGRSEDICRDDRPRNRYFIGSLANRPQQMDGPDPDDDLFSRLAPSSMGLEIRVKPRGEKARLLVQPAFNVYYRIFPDLEHQRRLAGYPRQTSDQEQPRSRERWAIAYRKICVQVEPVAIPIPQQLSRRQRLSDHMTQLAITRALERACQQILNDPHRYYELPKGTAIPPEALSDQEAFERFCRQIAATGREELPSWQVMLQVEARPVVGDLLQISLMLLNNSPDDGQEHSLTDHYLFDVCLQVEGQDAELQPFVFDLLPKDYRYDRHLWGLGHNCSVARVEELNAVRTEHTPIYQQPVYTTRDRVESTLPGAAFQDLAQEPIPVLHAIADAMDQYLHQWEQRLQAQQRDPGWDAAMLAAAESDWQAFAGEIARYRRGISVLERYSTLLRAFQLMNRTFASASRHDSWRLFQIVYIVTQLPAIAAREYDLPEGREDWDYVDVLWFPTGGGKTEAYLGLIVCAAFFDRLRGKTAGVTAWMRFPLRLLSLQQLQRMADILAAAECLRRQTAPINTDEYDPFSVAYLVGADNTPNRLVSYNQNGQDSWLNRLWRQPQLLQSFLTIPRCPFCGQHSVRMDLEEETVRLVHRCTNPSCSEAVRKGILPVFIVDNEIYRYLPTVLVGTIDKITAIGYERKVSHLFGAVSHKCPQHGYLSLGECTEKYACTVKPKDFIPVRLKDPSPVLQIQDELHLLRQEIGAFDAHYETFIDSYQQRMQKVRMKIIAATATIEEYEHQIEHLYNRKARRFPVPGPELGESFYATTEAQNLRRLFIGIMPHNYTHINAIVRIAELYHKAIEDLRRDPAGAIARLKLTSVDSPARFLGMLSHYEVFVTYLLSRREGDRLDQSFEGQLNRALTEAGYSEVDSRSITSATTFSEVARILDQLEQPDPDFARRLRSLTATSTISHGVDVERLNCLCFFGMPRQTAEYIQTSSRVGRDHPGLVFVCFNPARERDQSHYHLFTKYHEYLDRLVEPVPVNRWSKFAIRRTIPGLFMALLLNDYNLRLGGGGKKSLYFSKQVRQLLESRRLRPDEMVAWLNEAYCTGRQESGQEFAQVIQEKVSEYFDMLRNPQKNFTSENLTEQPMQSLRDVDEQIDIIPDKDSRLLMSQAIRG